MKLAIYGAGGFGKEVAAMVNYINKLNPTWEFIGFFDDSVPQGKLISHLGPVLGNLDTLNRWSEDLSVVFAIGNPVVLKKLIESIYNPRIEFPNLFHPDVYFADPLSFKAGKGNLAVRGVSFSVDVEIGDFNQFNSFSALAHDVKVGSYNVFMPLSRISGEVRIGDANYFGIGSVVLQTVIIGHQTRIGAGSYVLRSTEDNHLYFGNPAKKTYF
ncbi:MAG: serine acetyltransferase [Bacteroidales bacterium]